MSSLLRVKLEGLPPSVNQMYRTGKYGTRYKKLEVEEWQGEVSNAIRQEWGKVRPYTEEVEVRIIFTVKGNRRWDIDNRLKALLDCLELAGVINDDSQIWGIEAYKERGGQDAVEIAMKEYTELCRK